MNMLEIKPNFSLKNLNTFGVEALAKWYTEVSTDEELFKVFEDPQWAATPKLILGGGSNMLFTSDFEGLVIKINYRGIESQIVPEGIKVTAGGGENWHNLVRYCVDRNYGGMENLSLIPGSVGASPVQNIGAYGVEIKDILHTCRAFDTQTKEFRIFTNTECKFSYRDSIFKNECKGRYIITNVTFMLSEHPVLNLQYGAIKGELDKRGISNPTIKDVSQVVSDIRVSKLPDPKTIGNAGSFFKNPVVDSGTFAKIESVFPDIVHFSAPNDRVKLAAGWMIEKCGFKGVINGNTGTWKNQALVLVNHGFASGNEIFDFSQHIIDTVNNTFGITLEREVNII